MIPLFHVNTGVQVIPGLEKTFASGFISQGPKVLEFEKLLGNYFGNSSVVTTNSCTSSLFLSLQLLKNANTENNWSGISENDHVLSVPLTCTATNWPILHNGYNLRWVDVDPQTFNISLDDLEKKMNEFTKVILLIHWGGSPVDLDRLCNLQNNHEKKYGFRPVVIQDCAHAFGAEWNCLKIGNEQIGDICCFSFQAIKLLTTGDGGAITFGNRFKFLEKRARLLRWYGIDRETSSDNPDYRLESDVAEAGYKMHMNDLSATIGIANFDCVDSHLITNRINAGFLMKELPDAMKPQLIHPNASSSFWLLSFSIDRKTEFIQYMKDRGIVVSQVHKRNDTHSCVQKCKSDLPNLDLIENRLVCIPVGYWLTEQQLRFIVICCRDFFQN